MDKDVKKKPSPAAAQGQRVSAAEYLRGVRTEMKKVVWPTRKELTSFTAVVIIACVFFSLLFSAVDSVVLIALSKVLGINMLG